MTGRDATSRRVLDVGLASLVLVATLPLWPFIALAIKLDSRGPVLYRGERLGRGARPFEILKFRTMVDEAAASGPAITVGGDRRVTRVGRVLRLTKLDELPQLLNVVRGDMALVGPRPEHPRYLAHYPDHLRAVFDYRPGLTSPASIAYRHEEDVLAEAGGAGDAERFYVDELLPRKVALDLEYCRTRSLRRDLGVLVRTVTSVARLRSG